MRKTILEDDFDSLRANNIDIDRLNDIILNEKIQNFRFSIKRVNSYNAIKNLIEKWYPPSNNQLKINEVVKDIYCRLIDKHDSDVFYINGKISKDYPHGKFQYRFIRKKTVVLFISYYNKKATVILISKP